MYKPTEQDLRNIREAGDIRSMVCLNCIASDKQFEFVFIVPEERLYADFTMACHAAAEHPNDIVSIQVTSH